MTDRASRRQVLVVDGEADYVKMLHHLLENHGFDVLTAQTAVGAIQKAESLDIDIVLLGERLSDFSGFDLCRKLKSNTKTEHIPVMLMTRSLESEDRIKGYHLGADDCFHKESEKSEIFARMDAVWRRSNGEFKMHKDGRQKEIVDELSRIIDQKLIEPHFQPIYFLKPFRLFGLEVLSRPKGETILSNPEELFKAAVKHDMYYPLEMLCWQKAIDVLSSKAKNEHLFFNCSPHLVENEKFPLVKDIFSQAQIPFNKVVLEITERSSVNEYALFYNRLNEYRDHGFSFAIDDVGGGYSSLESIVATKPEVVKIDAHIIRDIHKDPVKRSIVKFVVAFCKENQIVCVAEGVETKEEMDVVSILGVDAVQGYFLFRPTADLNVREMKDLCVDFS